MSENSKKINKKTINLESLISVFDENGNGKLDFEDIIIKCLRLPGIKINRENFLRTELSRYYSEDVVNKAILENPMHAKITDSSIDNIAKSVIKFEQIQATGVSGVLSAPGGIAMAATIPADIVQYYGYLLRISQKLLYLYGYPELELNYSGDILDSSTMSTILVTLLIMFGVNGANKVLKRLAQGVAEQIGKKIMKTAVTKTAWYPMLKKLCKCFNVLLTKQVLKNATSKTLPIIGFAIGGTFTYVSFGKCCKRLQNELKDTIFSNPNYKEELYEADNNITIDISCDDDDE